MTGGWEHIESYLRYYQHCFLLFLTGDFKDRAQMLDFNIRIKNVTRNDAGKYRCEVSTPSEQGPRLEEDTVTLEVLGAVLISVPLLFPP